MAYPPNVKLRKNVESLVIKNATLYDHKGSLKSDLKITGGKINQIGLNLQTEKVIDGTSLAILPACIDLNIQLNHYTQNTLRAIEQKAILGGVGTLLLHSSPNEVEFLKFFNTQNSISLFPNALPYLNNQVQEISKLYHNGTISLSLETSLPNYALKCIYEYAQMFSLPCTCRLTNSLGGVSISSNLSYQMGLSSIFAQLEEMEFLKFFPLSDHYKIPTLLHSLNDFKLFQKIKSKKYLKSEISIHHLILNEEKIIGYNTWAKLDPPLQTKNIQLSFLQEIKNIDFLTSLHREFSISSKEQTFEDASSGVDCLGFYFSLLYTELVLKGHLSLEELSAKTSYNPAQFLKLNQGEIKEGVDANLILIDLNEKFQIQHPLYGEKELFGKIKGFISPKTGFQRVN